MPTQLPEWNLSIEVTPNTSHFHRTCPTESACQKRLSTHLYNVRNRSTICTWVAFSLYHFICSGVESFDTIPIYRIIPSKASNANVINKYVCERIDQSTIAKKKKNALFSVENWNKNNDDDNGDVLESYLRFILSSRTTAAMGCFACFSICTRARSATPIHADLNYANWFFLFAFRFSLRKKNNSLTLCMFVCVRV